MVKHTFRNKRKHKKTLKRKTQKRKFTITNPLNGNKYIVYPFKKLWGGKMVVINGFNYDDEKKLGQGSFASVYEATKNTDNKKYAIKVINTNDNNEEDIKNEISILEHIKTSNNNNCRDSIICIEDGFRKGNKYYIITELFNKEQYSELFDFNFTGLNDNDLAKIISNICKTVYELHKINIAHRDIKLENFMIDKTNYNVKILDFGLACLISENIGECKNVVGTLEYIDPVLDYNTRMYNNYNQDSDLYPINLKSGDLWSLGILIFEIIAKTIDFKKNDTDVSELKNIWIKDITFNLNNLFSNDDEYNNFIEHDNNSVIVNSFNKLTDSTITITNNFFDEINNSCDKKKYRPYNIINKIHINLNTLMESLIINNRDEETDENIKLLKIMINAGLYNKISNIIEYYWFSTPITDYYEPKISRTTSTNGFQNYLKQNIYNEQKKATYEQNIAKQIFDKSITINQICKANNWHRAKLINLLDYNIKTRHITSPSIVSAAVSNLKTVFGLRQ